MQLVIKCQYNFNEPVYHAKGTRIMTTQPSEQPDGHAQHAQQTSNVHFHGTAPVYVVLAKKNGLAVAGFVLSLVSLFLSWTILVAGICWVLAVVFSAVGLHAANTQGKPHRGLAIAGLVISIAPLVIIIALIATATTFWG